ncbi:MAG: cysteine desulfurase family protein [Bacteroidetes bacterium]|nr:cysteine desulfurase family protein [Bacteroidota bacterium]MDA0936754.1 cysteine desulfurase family protein [Bacteroidota bacterium]
MKVYFDNAASTPMRKQVIEVMTQSMSSNFGNPSSTHAYGRTAKSALETARKSIAKLLNCQPQEIIFTSGGTESDNMILRCAVKDLHVKTIISSPIEHHAVLHPLDDLEKEGVRIRYVDLDENGSPNLDHLQSLLSADDSKKLVSLMHINNEIGNVLDINRVGEICRAEGAFFHTDAVQGVGHYPYDLTSQPIDFLSAAAHKFHGPKGIGFAYIKNNTGMEPFIVGGPQERGLRAGTESVHNIVGLQKAIEVSYENLDSEKDYILGLKKYFIEKLKHIYPQVHFNGLCENLERSTYTLVNVALPLEASKSQLLNFHMDLKGIACSKGSACQAGVDIGSHVLANLKRSEEVKKYPSLRFSFSSFNTKEEIDYLIASLMEFQK